MSFKHKKNPIPNLTPFNQFKTHHQCTNSTKPQKKNKFANKITRIFILFCLMPLNLSDVFIRLWIEVFKILKPTTSYSSQYSNIMHCIEKFASNDDRIHNSTNNFSKWSPIKFVWLTIITLIIGLWHWPIAYTIFFLK